MPDETLKVLIRERFVVSAMTLVNHDGKIVLLKSFCLGHFVRQLEASDGRRDVVRMREVVWLKDWVIERIAASETDESGAFGSQESWQDNTTVTAIGKCQLVSKLLSSEHFPKTSAALKIYKFVKIFFKIFILPGPRCHLVEISNHKLI